MKGLFQLVLSTGLAATAFASGAQSAPSSPEVYWPLAWDTGQALVYDDTYTKRARRPAGTIEVHGRGATHVAGKRDGDGYLQRWRSVNLEFQVDGPGEMSSAMAKAAEAFEGLEIQVRLDVEGAFTSIANLDEIVPRYRQSLDEVLGEALSDLRADGDDAPELRDFMDNLLDQLASPSTLGVSLAETPAAYNFPGRGGLVPGREYAWEDEGQMPFGGQPVLRRNTMVLTPAADDRGRYDLSWRIEPDPEALRAHLVKAFDAMMAGLPEAAGKGAEAFADEVEMSVAVDYRIDAATGIVERMRRITRKRMGGTEEDETSLMVLRSPMAAGGTPAPEAEER